MVVTSWTAALVLWAGLVFAGVYWLRNWHAVGRDPKPGTIIPLYKPPGNLAPAALQALHRFGSAEDEVLNAGTLGTIAELLRSGDLSLATRDDRYVLAVQPPTGKATGCSASFLHALGAPGPVTGSSLRHAARVQRWWLTSNVLLKYIRINIAVILAGIAIMATAAFGAGALVPDERDVSLLFAFALGWFATLPAVMARIMWRSRLAHRRWAAAGVSVLSLLAVAGAAFYGLGTLAEAREDPAKAADAALIAGCFLLTPLTAVFATMLRAPTPEGRALMDDIDGFRLFLSTTEDGRYTIEGWPELSTEKVEPLRPYAIALGIEHRWANAIDKAVRQAVEGRAPS